MTRSAPLIAIVGPTGSGKSDLAIALALRFGGEVLNCDSVQVYRHFDVGTAKTPPEERRGVPHHLMDLVNPDQPFTAGDFTRMGREALRDVTARGSLPIVVGGTGFYLRALLEGLFEGPARNEALRGRLAAREDRRPGSLHRILQRLDPHSAARIHANDLSKTMRALEVRLLTLRPMTALFEQGRDGLTGYRLLKLGLNPERSALYEHLNRRARQMFEAGLLDEVRRLAAQYPRSAKPFESLGYAQALRALDGDLSVDEAMAETQMMTRRYAKRQWTWFRRDTDVIWLEGFGGNREVQESAAGRVAAFLDPAPVN